jgi:hypothetical protein
VNSSNHCPPSTFRIAFDLGFAPRIHLQHDTIIAPLFIYICSYKLPLVITLIRLKSVHTVSVPARFYPIRRSLSLSLSFVHKFHINISLSFAQFACTCSPVKRAVRPSSSFFSPRSDSDPTWSSRIRPSCVDLSAHVVALDRFKFALFPSQHSDAHFPVRGHWPLCQTSMNSLLAIAKQLRNRAKHPD